jgi:hypothetical protein
VPSPDRRRLGAAGLVLAALALAASSGCAETGVSANDAYKIGCPAVDAAAAGGSAASSATAAGLKALRDSNQLAPEAQAWVEAAVAALENPDSLPADTKKMIIDGCERNGYRLQNLKP